MHNNWNTLEKPLVTYLNSSIRTAKTDSKAGGKLRTMGDTGEQTAKKQKTPIRSTGQSTRMQ